jgi:FMN-binding domain
VRHKATFTRSFGVSAALMLLLASATALPSTRGQGRYLEPAEFLSTAFAGVEPAPGTLWINTPLRAELEQILGHRFALLRVRYWHVGASTAWILEEIGKEEPITIGVAIRNDRVATVRVLEFRESRGWEVRYPFFTDQFTGGQLDAGNRIDLPIDGITGATLSVNAVTRIVNTALRLHAETRLDQAGQGPSPSATH